MMVFCMSKCINENSKNRILSKGTSPTNVRRCHKSWHRYSDYHHLKRHRQSSSLMQHCHSRNSFIVIESRCPCSEPRQLLTTIESHPLSDNRSRIAAWNSVRASEVRQPMRPCLLHIWMTGILVPLNLTHQSASTALNTTTTVAARGLHVSKE